MERLIVRVINFGIQEALNFTSAGLKEQGAELIDFDSTALKISIVYEILVLTLCLVKAVVNVCGDYDERVALFLTSMLPILDSEVKDFVSSINFVFGEVIQQVESMLAGIARVCLSFCYEIKPAIKICNSRIRTIRKAFTTTIHEL